MNNNNTKIKETFQMINFKKIKNKMNKLMGNNVKSKVN